MKLPKYQSRKIVEAAKIARIEIIYPSVDPTGQGPIGALLHFVDIPDAQRVGQAYIDEHDPRLGGYYVRYADGYESWSPAEAFEQGYERVHESADEPRR